MKIKFCLPIVKSSIKEIITEIQKNPDFDFYEIWIDYLPEQPGVILDEVKNLILQFPDNLILCFRRKDGKDMKINLNERKKIIELTENLNVLVDCDIKKQKEDLEFIKNNNLKTKTIVSFHDYEKILSENETKGVISEMEKYNPTIYKIAMQCDNSENSLTMMELLLKLKKQNKKAIVIGMGNYGKITRIFGAMNGNEINFVSGSEKTASGQMTKSEMQDIINRME